MQRYERGPVDGDFRQSGAGFGEERFTGSSDGRLPDGFLPYGFHKSGPDLALLEIFVQSQGQGCFPCVLMDGRYKNIFKMFGFFHAQKVPPFR